MEKDNIVAADQPQQTQQAETQAEAVAASQPENAPVEAVSVAEGAAQPAQGSGPADIKDLKPGMRLMGRVKNIVDFGAFIDIGVGRDGLAHISTLKRAGVDKTLKVGDEIEVQVRRADLDNNRISLTIPGAGRADKTRLEDLQVGATVTGRVVRLVDFGAFVDIDAQTDGLLHISQLAGGFVSQVSEVLEIGQEVEVRILDVDSERRRISLTMKPIEEQRPARIEHVEPMEMPERPRRDRDRDSYNAERSSRDHRDSYDEDRPPRERRDRGSRRREPQVISTEQEPAEPGSTGLFAEAWEKALRDRHGRSRS